MYTTELENQLYWLFQKIKILALRTGSVDGNNKEVMEIFKKKMVQ